MSITTDSTGFDSDDGNIVSDVSFDDALTEVVEETKDVPSPDMFAPDDSGEEENVENLLDGISTPEKRRSCFSKLVSERLPLDSMDCLSTPKKNAKQELSTTPTVGSFRKKILSCDLKKRMQLVTILENDVPADSNNLECSTSYDENSDMAVSNLFALKMSTRTEKLCDSRVLEHPVKPNAQFSSDSKVRKSLLGYLDADYRLIKTCSVSSKVSMKKNTVVKKASKQKKTKEFSSSTGKLRTDRNRRIRFPYRRRNIEGVMNFELLYDSDRYKYLLYNCDKNSDKYFRVQKKLSLIFTGYSLGSNYNEAVSVNMNMPEVRRHAQFMFDATKVLHTRKFNEGLLKVFYMGKRSCAVMPINSQTTVTQVYKFSEWIFSSADDSFGLYVDGRRLEMGSSYSEVLSAYGKMPWTFVTDNVQYNNYLSECCSSALKWVPIFYENTEELHSKALACETELKKLNCESAQSHEDVQRKKKLEHRFSRWLLDFYNAYSIQKVSVV